jgi:ABC-type multidrug transport system fused ATPase/permease subunit
MDPEGALAQGTRNAQNLPAREIRFRNVTFAYPGGGDAVLSGFDLTIPAGSSIAIVGQNGAGKTTLAKLLCRLYDPQAGAIEVDGADIRTFDLDSWRSRVTAVFQDFVRFELPLRDNVAPGGAPDDVIKAALADAGAFESGGLDTVLARGYEGGNDLSGGQWQRIALARTLCAVRLGAGVVLLDEPTAQLDVRGEAEIFERGARLHTPRDDDSDLAPVLHRPPGRPHLRARTRPRRRARYARRTDGGERPLSHDVRSAGVALRHRRRRRRRGKARCPRLTTCRPHCRRCGAR